MLENDTNHENLKRIIRALPLELLKRKLISIYNGFKTVYNLQYDKKVFETSFQCNSFQPPKNIEKAEIILETGFLIYFLLHRYYEIDENVYGREIEQDNQEKLAELGLIDFKDNIISQMLEFLRSLLEFLLNYAKFIKSKFSKKHPEDLNRPKDYLVLYKEAFHFFAKNSAHIEVVHGDHLEKVYFVKLSFCHHLTKEAKQDFHSKVNRTSIKSKISSLVDNSRFLIELAKHEEK